MNTEPQPLRHCNPLLTREESKICNILFTRYNLVHTVATSILGKHKYGNLPCFGLVVLVNTIKTNAQFLLTLHLILDDKREFHFLKRKNKYVAVTSLVKWVLCTCSNRPRGLTSNKCCRNSKTEYRSDVVQYHPQVIYFLVQLLNLVSIRVPTHTFLNVKWIASLYNTGYLRRVKPVN